jgi:hypothetical protein
MGSGHCSSDERTDVPEGLGNIAQEQGCVLFRVCCHEHGWDLADRSSPLRFYAIGPSLPRQGEFIRLQNDRSCEVIRVEYETSILKLDAKPDAAFLVPQVIARLVDDSKPRAFDDGRSG